MKQDHIAIIVSDYNAALRFYGLLGFHVTERYIRPHDIMAFLTDGETVLELFVKQDAPARVTEPEALGLRHLCFAVRDLDAICATLTASGGYVEPVRTDFSGRRFTFCKDPDGLPIEFKEI